MTTRKSITFLLMSIVLARLAAVPNARAALIWTGLSTASNDWGDTNNWSPNQLPTVNDSAIFGNAGGYTNVLGAVNNVVNSNLTISDLLYSAVSNSVSANFHTTLINTGVILTADSPINSTNKIVLFVGADVDGANDQISATITGVGTLAIGNLASPDTNNDIMVSVRALTANSGIHKATLDLSGLNKFTFGGGRFQVTGNGVSAVLAGAQYAGQDRPWGSVLLARTNVITAARPRTDQFPFAVAPFAVCVNRYANASANITLLELGQENIINTEAITVAGARGGNSTHLMRFRSGLINPTLKLRNADAISRVAEIGIGDNDIPNGATVQSIGNIDLSLGTVDALVDTLIVGRNNGIFNTQVGANGTGTLTLGAGTCDVITLNIGCQNANNGNRATGTVNVRTNATLVAGNINIGRDSGGGTLGGVATGTGVGTLTINGGTVKLSGDLVENDAPDGNGTSTLTINSGGTLDLMPPGDTVAGNLQVDTLNLGLGTLTNYGTLGVRFINQTTPVTDFVVYSGQALAPVAPGIIGALAVKTNLTLNNGTLRFDLDSPFALNDQITVGEVMTLNGINIVDLNAVNGTLTPGDYTLITYGTLIGATNNLQVGGAFSTSRYAFAFDTNTVPNVNLNISGSASNLIWLGDGAANVWNVNNAPNWNTNTEKFYSLDTVVFDDTSTNRMINVVGTLVPGSVTVNSDANYTFAGSGKISGSTGLTKLGSGTLTVSNANEFVGAVGINAGTLRVNGALGKAAIHVNSGATLGGDGAMLGPVTVLSGGSFTPGVSIGTLAISNDLVLSEGSTTVFEANLDTLACDKVVGLNKVTYRGTLSLMLSGRPVVGGDTFQLFSATTIAIPVLLYSPYAGTFSSIVPTTPGAGLLWNTNTLATDGTLRVVSTAPTSVTLQATGSQLELSWPTDHIGWKLQRQINPLDVGLSNNWVDVAGSTTTNRVIATMNQANATVFYRLISPDIP